MTICPAEIPIFSTQVRTCKASLLFSESSYSPPVPAEATPTHRNTVYTDTKRRGFVGLHHHTVSPCTAAAMTTRCLARYPSTRRLLGAVGSGAVNISEPRENWLFDLWLTLRLSAASEETCSNRSCSTCSHGY